MLNSFSDQDVSRFEALLDGVETAHAFATPGMSEPHRPLSAAKVKAIAEDRHSPYLLCVRDLKGKFVKLSHAWETRLGYSMMDLTGAPLLHLVHPADVWSTHDRMVAVTSQSAVGVFTNRYRHQAGGYRNLSWAARLYGDQVFGLALDVTLAGLAGA